ncbi:MAG: hypothetical protein IKY70_05420 [Bacteroidales bacterium]|nr:hypothetical protein [Bacteroidales bacterium]
MKGNIFTVQELIRLKKFSTDDYVKYIPEKSICLADSEKTGLDNQYLETDEKIY